MKIRQTGHALTELVVLTGIVLAALYLPIPWVGDSAFVLLAKAIKTFQAHSALLLAMP